MAWKYFQHFVEYHEELRLLKLVLMLGKKAWVQSVIQAKKVSLLNYIYFGKVGLH